MLVIIAGAGGGGGHSGIKPPKGMTKPNYATGSSGLYFGSSNKGGSTFGSIQESNVGGIWGGSYGGGPDFGLYFGDAEEMCADGAGGTLHTPVGSLSVSRDDNGNWSVGLSIGGKGVGMGVSFHENKSHTTTIWNSKYGK